MMPPVPPAQRQQPQQPPPPPPPQQQQQPPAEKPARTLGGIRWAAAGAVAVAEFLQKLTPALDFLPRWSSLAISYAGTLVVLVGAAMIARLLWNEPHDQKQWRVAAVMLVVLSYGLTGGYYAWKFGAFGKPESSTVAVFAFDAAGYGAREIGLDVAAQLTSLMDGAGGLRTVNARKVAYHYMGSRSEAHLDSAVGIYIAKRVGAGMFVTGSVNLIGKRVALSARLYDVASRQRLAEVSEVGDTANLPRLTDQLALGLVSQYRYAQGVRRLIQSADSASWSVRDLNVYLRAEDAIRRGDFQAVTRMLDPLEDRPHPFVPASYGIAAAEVWNERADNAERAVRRALRHPAGLTERDTTLLHGFLASLHGERETAQNRFGQLLWRFDQEDTEARYLVGELLFRTNPHLGAPRGQAHEHFQSVLRVDSLHFRARWHLLHLALAAADDSAAREHAQRALQGRPDAMRADPLRLVERCFAAKRGPACPDTVLASVARSPGADMALDFLSDRWRARPDSASWTALDSLVAKTERSDNRGMSLIADLTRAELALARGRWTGAMEALQGVPRHQAAVYRGLFASLPFLALSAEELESARRELEAWTVSVPPLPTTYTAARPAVREYLLGMVLLRAGRRDSAQAIARRLGADAWRTGGEHWPAVASRLSRNLGRALQSELTPGNRRRALRLLEQVEGVPAMSVREHPMYAHDRERYRRAELLFALGRRDEAADWFRSLLESSTTAVYDAPASYWLGRIHQEAGRPEEAAKSYQKVVALWCGCEERFRETWDDAARRLRALDAAAARLACPARGDR